MIEFHVTDIDKSAAVVAEVQLMAEDRYAYFLPLFRSRPSVILTPRVVLIHERFIT